MNAETPIIPDGYVLHMPTPKPVPHLVFGAVRRHVPAHASPSGRDQIERTCLRCGAIKVTLLGEGKEHRAWRRSEEGLQIEGVEGEPVCVPVVSGDG